MCLAVGLGPVLAWQQSLRADVAEAPDGPTASNPGALVLRDDVQTVKGWWRNGVARVLLNFFLTSLGTAIGVWTGGLRMLGRLVG